MTKASTMSLKDLVHFSKEEGDFFLRDRRMMLISSDAFGMLCRDLIVALGLERAKRFLQRYGWQFGVSEARYLNDMFSWDDDLEWILAGSKMHNIAGRVFSTPIRMNINKSEGLFDVEGYWIDSNEAKQFLMHFNKHHEPVCHFLVGYASGYCTETVGTKIIFKEVECVAKGDPRCKYVGKTLEQWGDGLPEDLIDDGQEKLEDELDRAYKRIEKQKEILNRVTTVSQELTRMILQGKGLDDMAEILGKSLNCNVIIENQHLDMITGYGQVLDSSLNKVMEHLAHDKGNQQYSKINTMLKEHCTVQFEIPEPFFFPHVRLVTPIMLRNQVLGYISILKPEGQFGELESVLLERSANICAIQLLNERTVVETEQRLKGELLDELFNPSADISAVSRRLAYLDHDLSQPHYVFVFQFETSGKKGSIQDARSTALREKIMDCLKRRAEQNGFHILLSTKLERVHALIPQAYIEKLNMKVRDYGESLIEGLGDEAVTTVLGISGVCHNRTSFSKAFNEAVKAIDIGRIKGKTERVVLSTDIKHLSILLDARRPEELEQYASNLLGALQEYDQKYATELLKTIYYYFDNECNLHKTARTMNISISGMRYRLDRIKQLSDFDLSNSLTRFEVQLALEIFLVLGKIDY
ncbi:XylR N-terminal domain-containing protein [Paenibacillus sabinae]|uniref:PucR family transcriptional regulator n=1 Tax=Paenibacillus sabinae T27 TaxID=1268072 RepID=X4ZFX6_9BACL|nr:XylR N-terminal domain-containing protein [Paenibacillus sabinae]AHV95655.1 PucR family transcriptional regulator [Paenibacillus sabinae T27]